MTVKDMDSDKKEKLYNTRQRISDHGEVYTAKRQVNAMLDLVKQETERIESRFLEPACGTGNFLTEILQRKLNVIESRYKKSQLEYERYAVIAVSSIYGIDILEDNVKLCKKRLFELFNSKYSRIYRNKTKEDFKRTIKFLLDKNIIWGDALTLTTVEEVPKPIVFSEWSPVNGSKIKRRDYTFESLLSHAEMTELPLFSDLGDKVFIPKPVKEFPAVHYLKLADAEE